MQRRTLIRGLAGMTLAIAAGDLVALMARGTPPRPSRTQPAPAATLPPGVLRSPPRPDQLTDRTADPAGPPLPQAPHASALALICRHGWGALPPTGPLAPHRIERLTIHHTAVVAADSAGGYDRLRNYQRYHQRRGLTDLAYHFLIDRAGNLFEGRALSAAPGTFTRYDPTGHFTACLDGNFDEQSPSGPQLDVLVDLLAWAAEKFGVSPATIRGHRAYTATRCPGAALQALIADDVLRQRVDSKLATAGVELVPVCGQVRAARALLSDLHRAPGAGTASL